MYTILVVDDERSVRAILSSVLKKEGHEVIEATDGKQAIDLTREKNPHVILMDVRMPGMDGLTASRKLKGDEKTKHIPILVITAFDERKSEAIEAGVDDFINKPFDTEEVAIRVRSMLRIRDLTDELQKVVSHLNKLEK